MNRTPTWVSIVSLGLFAGGVAHAAEFEIHENDQILHVDSGWMFPYKVAGFERLGDPAGIEGTATEAIAKYERTLNGVADQAIVALYPPNSPALDASLEGAKGNIVVRLRKVPQSQVWSEGPFRVGKSPVLVGDKALYKIGLGPDSSQTNLYYFDTGKWVVKIRMATEKTTKDTAQAFDDFVRAQAWETLGLTAQTCTGTACKVDRPIAVHGLVPEQFAVIALNARQEVFPQDMPACEQSAVVSALTADAPAASGQPEPIRLVTACAPRKGMRASFFRLTVPQDMRAELERVSPDGLSLRDPITFVALADAKVSAYTQMYDGKLDSATAADMMKAITDDKPLMFATGDKDGKNTQPVIRFISDMSAPSKKRR